MKNKYNKVIVDWAYDFNTFADIMVEFKEKGEMRVGEFNGTKFYTDKIEDVDSMYVQYFGMTKAEKQKDDEEYRKQLEREFKEREENAVNNIPNWIDRGEKILAPEYHELWKEIVPIRVRDIYAGMELTNALDIIECFDNNNLDNCVKTFRDAGHSGASAGMLFAIIFNTHKKGQEIIDLIKH